MGRDVCGLAYKNKYIVNSFYLLFKASKEACATPILVSVRGLKFPTSIPAPFIWESPQEVKPHVCCLFRLNVIDPLRS